MHIVCYCVYGNSSSWIGVCFTHMLQGCFTIPSTSEATLKYMGKIDLYQTTTQQQRTNHAHISWVYSTRYTVYPKKYAHSFWHWHYTLTDFPISIRLTSLALWQSNDCPSASKATLMNMDKYFMWIHYERLHNHNIAKHTKPCAYFLGYTVYETYP